MIRKTKYSIIKSIITNARQMNIALNKKDERLSYIIEAHQFFVWNRPEEFEDFIVLSLKRIVKSNKGQLKSIYSRKAS